MIAACWGQRGRLLSATTRRLEHPLRNFQCSATIIKSAAKDAYCAFGNATRGQHGSTVPRMPTAPHYNPLSTMGVLLLGCTANAGHIARLAAARPRAFTSLRCHFPGRLNPQGCTSSTKLCPNRWGHLWATAVPAGTVIMRSGSDAV